MAINKPRVSSLVRTNEANHCVIPMCHGHRHSLSKWCLRHLSTYERTGDPQGVNIRATQWKHYRTRVHDLLTSNSDHPGLVRATSFIQGWMVSAEAQASTHQWAKEASRLHRNGVTAIQVITELAACWSYLQDNPRLCKSDNQLVFTLSKAVLGLTPRPRRFTVKDNLQGSNGYAIRAKPAALAYIGKHLSQVLSALLVNVHQSLRTELTQAAREVEDMRQPFTTSNAALATQAGATDKRQFRHFGNP